MQSLPSSVCRARRGPLQEEQVDPSRVQGYGNDGLGGSLRQVALMRMEGYSNEEIARHLDCGIRTLTRKLEIIRRTWLDDREA